MPAKEGLLKALVSWDVTLLLMGNDLPALILLIGGEAPGSFQEGFLPPDVDGFLIRKEVCDMEKPAEGYVLKRGTIDCKEF